MSSESISEFKDKKPRVFFPTGWANAVVRWIQGIHSESGTIKTRNTINPTDKSASLDVDIPVLVEKSKELLLKSFVGRGDETAIDCESLIVKDGKFAVSEAWLDGRKKKKTDDDGTESKSDDDGEGNGDEENESESGDGCSCLYPFKTEKFTNGSGVAGFIIYLPQDSFVVDNVPISITSGLTACNEKGADWYYLPTPQVTTGKRWYLRIEESSNTVSGSVSIVNTDNNTSVRFMPIASISFNEEGTMQYIVGSVFGMKVGDSSSGSGSGSGTGSDDIGQITANPPYLTVRRTHYTDLYSQNEIPEIWIKAQGLTAGDGAIFKRITNTNIKLVLGTFQSEGLTLQDQIPYPNFNNRPSDRTSLYPKNSLKPLVTFRYLLGDESTYDDTPWIYCGSKREFESGSFDIYAVVMSVVMNHYDAEYSIINYYNITKVTQVTEDLYQAEGEWRDRRTKDANVINGNTVYTVVLLSTEPLSMSDIQFIESDRDQCEATTYETGVLGTQTSIAHYRKEKYSVLSKRQLFAGKVATISNMEVTQVATFSDGTGSVECAVVFKDWDGTTLKSMTVAYNGTAVPPNDPTRTNYEFAGWDRPSMANITTDTTITATYSELHTVTFIDWNNSVLKTEKVADGQDATPPSDPTREDYIFTGWSSTSTDIHYSKTIQAQYRRDIVEFGFEIGLKDGTWSGNGETSADANSVRIIIDRRKSLAEQIFNKGWVTRSGYELIGLCQNWSANNVDYPLTAMPADLDPYNNGSGKAYCVWQEIQDGE